MMIHTNLLLVLLLIFNTRTHVYKYDGSTNIGLSEIEKYMLYAEEQYITSELDEPARKIVSTIFKDFHNTRKKTRKAMSTRNVPRVGRIRSPTNKV